MTDDKARIYQGPEWNIAAQRSETLRVVQHHLRHMEKHAEFITRKALTDSQREKLVAISAAMQALRSDVGEERNALFQDYVLPY